MKQVYVESYFKGFRKLTSYSLLKDYPQREVIEKRLKIIKFFDTYGKEATKEAFSVSRSTVYLWKKKLKEEKRLTCLAPLSRAPKRRRRREVNPLIIQFIKDYRTNHPGVGKEAIKPELDEYCRKKGIPLTSESTIGRIIKDLKKRNLIPGIHSKLSFYGKTGKFRLKVIKPRRKKLRRKGYKPKEGGDLVEMDSITLFLEGIKRYILTAIDIKTGFGFAYLYKNLSSLNGVDFMKKFKEVAPFEIKRIQTDNGSEFEGYFRKFIQKEGIIHFHNYPRRPQSNPYIERFNRTIQEQYVRWHKDELYETEQFNKGLMEYLVWYNTKKPHKRLGRLPPLRYYLDNFIDDLQKSNMLWTLTNNCQSIWDRIYSSKPGNRQS